MENKLVIDNTEVIYASSYLESKGKKLKQFTAIQETFAAGAAISLIQGQQIFAGYIIGKASDISFTNIFEPGKTFNLVNVSYQSLCIADKLTNTQGCYIIGYIIDWE